MFQGSRRNPANSHLGLEGQLLNQLYCLEQQYSGTFRGCQGSDLSVLEVRPFLEGLDLINLTVEYLHCNNTLQNNLLLWDEGRWFLKFWQTIDAGRPWCWKIHLVEYSLSKKVKTNYLRLISDCRV